MSDYIQQTLAAYDDSPDKFVARTRDMVQLPELEAFIRMLPDKNGLVLDAGCAYGRDMEVLQNKYGRKCIGVDLSAELLKRGRALYPDFDFRQMDLRQLDFESGTFSGIWCNAVLLHFKGRDLNVVMDQLARVIKPKGPLFISVKEGRGSKVVVKSFSSNQAVFLTLKPRRK